MTPFSQMLAVIRDALAGLADDSAGTAVLVLAAVAAITMAILQIIKDVTPLRRVYQRCWMFAWIQGQANEFKRLHEAKDPSRSTNPDKAAADLVELATGRLADAFYDLSPEDMELQANAAGQIVLDESKRYPDLLYVLSAGAALHDIDRVRGGLPEEGSTQAYFEARSRLTRRIARNLQGARLALSNRWKLWMQLAALLLTTLLVEAVVLSSDSSDFVTFLLAIPIGLVGGYLAPIARDLLAALQRLRGGTS